MKTVNKIEVLGNLTSDVLVHETEKGLFASFQIATQEEWRTADGEKREEREFHRVAVVGGLADLARRKLKTGSRVSVYGRLKVRKFTDANGDEKKSAEIVVSQRQGGDLVIL